MPRLIQPDNEPILLVNTVEVSVVSPRPVEEPLPGGEQWIADIEVAVQISAAWPARALINAAALAADQAIQALTPDDEDPDFDARAVEALT
jgi:hypothetical protein